MKNKKRKPPSMDSPILADQDKYPYGLRISLGSEQLKALGLDLPDVGDKKTLVAKVEVVSISSNKSKGGEDHNHVEFQITDMSLGEKPKNREDLIYKS
jgi:hypothetical protein